MFPLTEKALPSWKFEYMVLDILMKIYLDEAKVLQYFGTRHVHHMTKVLVAIGTHCSW